MPGPRAPEEQRRAQILRAAFAVAARERLTGVTARAVAAEAGVSSGLVFFYFETIDALLVALLDWLLAQTLAVRSEPSVAPGESAVDRMLARVRHDLEQLPRNRAGVELLVDYWVLGTRHPSIRARIRAALVRYRDSFRPLADEVVRGDPTRWERERAEGLAGVAASFVEGCALQAVMDPARFDVEQSMSTLAALVTGAAAAR